MIRCAQVCYRNFLCSSLVCLVTVVRETRMLYRALRCQQSASFFGQLRKRDARLSLLSLPWGSSWRVPIRCARVSSLVCYAVAELDTAPHRRHGACSLVHTRTVVRVWPSHPQLIVHRRPIIFIYIPSQSLFIFGLSIYNPNARAPVTVNR